MAGEEPRAKGWNGVAHTAFGTRGRASNGHESKMKDIALYVEVATVAATLLIAVINFFVLLATMRAAKAAAQSADIVGRPRSVERHGRADRHLDQPPLHLHSFVVHAGTVLLPYPGEVMDLLAYLFGRPPRPIDFLVLCRGSILLNPINTVSP